MGDRKTLSALLFSMLIPYILHSAKHAQGPWSVDAVKGGLELGEHRAHLENGKAGGSMERKETGGRVEKAQTVGGLQGSNTQCVLCPQGPSGGTGRVLQ